MSRIRLDKLLVKKGLASDQSNAAVLIESGVILVNGAIQKSTNSFVETGSAIEFVPEKPKYVSRGGYKLEKALEYFNISPMGKRCLDIGASTGGFTDCLLKNGAEHVVALDVGHGQLDLSIRNDPKVTVLEKTNAKKLTPELIGGLCQLAVMDVSFTSVIPLIDSVVSCLETVSFIVLIKPQFEVDQKQIDARGIVNDPQAHKSCIEKVIGSLNNDLQASDLCVSPIKGTKGNTEYLCLIEAKQDRWQQDLNALDDRIDEVVKQALSSDEETHD